MSARRAYPSVLAVLVLAGCGGRLAASPPDGATTYRLRFEPGQVARYRTELRGVQVFGTGPSPAGASSETFTDVTHRVVAVEADGSATVEVDLDPVSATVNGQEVQLRSNPEPWQITVSPEGALLESTRPISLEAPDDAGPDGPTVQANPSGAINPFPFLAHQPVAPGGAWTGAGEAPSPFGGGTVPYRVAASVAGYETVAGLPATVIEGRVVMVLDVTVPAVEYLEGTGQSAFAAELPAEAAVEYQGELRYEQRVWLHAERGQVLRSEVAGSFVTDVAWTGVPTESPGFDPVHSEGRVEAFTERMG